MHVIICVDDNGGTFFNNRRQSQDRVLRQHLLARCGGRLWMNGYSAKQFGSDENIQLQVDEDFLSKAPAGEYCFVEGQPIAPWVSRLESLILVKWNRDYPFDRKLDLPLDNWKCTETEEFPGSSHDKLTLKVYSR